MASERVFDGKLLHVRRDTVRLPDGGTATREYIVHPGAVLIVPVLPDGRLVVERQYRYPVGAVFIEFPAGKLDPGEAGSRPPSASSSRKRATRRRRGRRSARIHPVVGIRPRRSSSTSPKGLAHVGAKLDDGEFLEIVTMSVDEMLAALDRGEITDAKTVAALLLYARRRRAER